MTMCVALCGIVLVAGVIGTIWLWFESNQPAPGEAPEDDGAAWDAGIEHVCWHCGIHLSGPLTGTRVSDQECWDCYCARTAPDDCPAVPNYVVKARRA